ncbi:hypothetical protein [Actinomyces ruminis]|uniref:Uncharacterized protein n=1 Tax=Actinomyces ruminis TaxID=1937003 RepID=A0ABX4MBP1_9ACTO|nr:hypothetical protein [Actinomyces ruminis]PHP52563.1 hypothetical protein BW737_008755 [Actinomyces ruminis]
MVKKTYKEEVVFAFHGEAVDDGTMTAGDYGRALMGYSQMVQAVVREAAPKAENIDLRVTATEQGSFATELILTMDLTWVEAVKQWFLSEDVAALGAAVGVTGVTFGSLIKMPIAVLKKLRGRKIVERKDVGKGMQTATLDDGQQLTEPTIVLNVSSSNVFVNGARDFTRPTTRPGVTSVTVGADDPEEITAADRAFFEPLPEFEGETVEVKQMRLKVLRLSFDDGPWRFETTDSVSGLPTEFTAMVEDDDFLSDVASHATSFQADDEIDAVVEIVYPPKHQRARRRYWILQVLDVHHPHEQPALFD